MGVLLNLKLNSCRKLYALYADSTSEREREKQRENAARICAGRLGGVGAKREEGFGKESERGRVAREEDGEDRESKTERKAERENARGMVRGGDERREGGMDGGLVSIRRQ